MTDGAPVVVQRAPADSTPAALIRLGEDVHRLRAALAAERLLTDVPAPTSPTGRCGYPPQE